MRPPQAFYDFSLQFHQDLDLVYPGWDSHRPGARHEIYYEDFRQGFGDQALRELAKYAEKLLADTQTDLGALWFRKSKADWVIPDKGVRFLFEDFLRWLASRS